MIKEIKMLSRIAIFLIMCIPCSAVEMLIYDKDNWMDALTEAEVTERWQKEPDFRREFDARWQRGDVIEMHEDGFWTGPKARGFDHVAFRMLSIPGVSLESVRYLSERHEKDGKMIRLRKYKVLTGRGKKAHSTTGISVQIENKEMTIESNKTNIMCCGSIALAMFMLGMVRRRRLVC